MRTAEHRDRLARARRESGAAEIDALLVTPGANLRYLTGYDALPLERLTCLVVRADADPVLVVPSLERPAAEASPAGRSGVELCDWPETTDPVEVVADLVRGSRRVGVDDHMWAEKVLRFRAALPDAEQVLAGTVLRGLRMRKSRVEVAALREAGAAIDRVHARMGEWLRHGRTEREVGRDIAAAILEEGHVRVDFVIVGSGPNSASPHHELSDRVIGAGETVVVDIGGTTADGYCSDATRTYALGEPAADVADYYDVLESAQAAAVAAVRPGIAAEDVDAAARTPITEAGYGPAFLHRTGHGIGLETHEDPYIVAGNSTPLEPGMTFSVEPGIYLSARHGARIEDIVVVTADGVEPLNRRPRELVALGCSAVASGPAGRAALARRRSTRTATDHQPGREDDVRRLGETAGERV